eukprot:CAMPEP_0201919596 /NCGR_PEP_ID=MMETSP0903-20130614/8434_1 /ASSEMBLY_ACC=CAM_ASM_000552 /TAXON_ID=420261 /ORGANISM="Thalassiosira antarctica, Strain CCMP982" /LENGTH=206 /DNA_ID=CAMNT_0048456149 /DNA_START=14 /DNA_END=634 /DNA_ORIENTATION=-
MPSTKLSFVAAWLLLYHNASLWPVAAEKFKQTQHHQQQLQLQSKLDSFIPEDSPSLRELRHNLFERRAPRRKRKRGTNKTKRGSRKSKKQDKKHTSSKSSKSKSSSKSSKSKSSSKSSKSKSSTKSSKSSSKSSKSEPAKLLLVCRKKQCCRAKCRGVPSFLGNINMAQLCRSVGCDKNVECPSCKSRKLEFIDEEYGDMDMDELN